MGSTHPGVLQMTHERTEHVESRPELDRRQELACDRENARGADDRVGIQVRRYPRQACGAVIGVVLRAIALGIVLFRVLGKR